VLSVEGRGRSPSNTPGALRAWRRSRRWWGLGRIGREERVRLQRLIIRRRRRGGGDGGGNGGGPWRWRRRTRRRPRPAAVVTVWWRPVRRTASSSASFSRAVAPARRGHGVVSPRWDGWPGSGGGPDHGARRCGRRPAALALHRRGVAAPTATDAAAGGRPRLPSTAAAPPPHRRRRRIDADSTQIRRTVGRNRVTGTVGIAPWGGDARGGRRGGEGPAARWSAEETVRTARRRRQALPQCRAGGWRRDPAGSGGGAPWARGVGVIPGPKPGYPSGREAAATLQRLVGTLGSHWGRLV
jgi:hypothetical protein